MGMDQKTLSLPKAIDRLWEARSCLSKAKREATLAWREYAEMYKADGMQSGPARAQAATHLPQDMLELLGIDRYGSKS